MIEVLVMVALVGSIAFLGGLIWVVGVPDCGEETCRFEG